MTKFKSTDNLHKPMENTLSIHGCPYAELLLMYFKLEDVYLKKLMFIKEKKAKLRVK